MILRLPTELCALVVVHADPDVRHSLLLCCRRLYALIFRLSLGIVNVNLEGAIVYGSSAVETDKNILRLREQELEFAA